MKGFSFKLCLWLLEFHIKRIPDNEKIAFLLKKLLCELDSQGHVIDKEKACNLISIWNHSGNVSIEYGGKWRIACGRLEDKQ